MAMLKVWDEQNNQWIIVKAPVPNGFGSVKIGQGIVIDSDKPDDILNILDGDHIKVIPNDSFDSIVISVQDIGDLTSLPTLNKSDLVSSIIELNSRVNDHGFTFKQIAPAAVWTIKHDLNRYPSVTVTDSGGNVVIGDVSFVDSNTVILSFSAEFSGTAYLN